MNFPICVAFWEYINFTVLKSNNLDEILYCNDLSEKKWLNSKLNKLMLLNMSEGTPIYHLVLQILL